MDGCGIGINDIFLVGVGNYGKECEDYGMELKEMEWGGKKMEALISNNEKD